MPAIKQNQDSTAPNPRSVDPAAYGPAPAGVVPVSASLDAALVTTFRTIIRASGTLTNGRVYPARDDDQAKSDLRFMRKHLVPTLTVGEDGERTERIKVNWYGEDGAWSFYLSLAKRTKRAAKSDEDSETETATE